MSGVDEKIGVTVADAGIADRVALQAQLVDHAPGGPARRILENTACAFLIERLTGSPLLIADANSLKYLAVRFGRKFQSHREHNIIGRKRCVPVFKIYFSPSEGLDPAGGRPVDLHLADIGSDLRAVGARVHPQRASDRSRHADQAFHAAQIVLGAGGDRAPEVGGAVDDDTGCLRSARPGPAAQVAESPREVRHRARERCCRRRGSGAARQPVSAGESAPAGIRACG